MNGSSTTLPAAMARAPSRRRLLLLLAAIAAVVVASFASLDLHAAAFLSRQALHRLAAFAAGFLPLATTPALLASIGRGVLETLAMSMLGTLIAALAGIVLALPAAARRRPLRRGIARLVLNGLRSVPELVWASLLLVAAGLGPFPGTLALALHTMGVLGRLFAESIENAPPEPAFALRLRGVSATRVFLFATLPQLWPQLVSYTLYRWENNIRAAAVLGVVGAGGLGQLLYVQLSLFRFPQAGSVLLAMIALVGLVDAASWAARRAMR